MIHPDRDEDLLLLAHGALPPLRAVQTRLHLCRCADCRRRFSDLRAASHALAAAVRGPRMPRWSLPALAPGGTVIAVWTLMAATVLVIVLLTVLTERGHHQAPDATRAGGPCRPDLPSDRCR